MARYIDSASEQQDQYVRYWLDSNIAQGIKAFRTQSGYYSFDALIPYETVLAATAKSKNLVAFVLGANDGQLKAFDVEKTLALIEGQNVCKLTVVAFSNAEFHPKTYHIIRADGSQTALVGSGNFTGSGISLNAEAAIVLDSVDGDDVALLKQIADAIDKWSNVGEGEGAFQILTMEDITELRDSGIIDAVRQKPIPHPGVPGKTKKKIAKGRIHHWKTKKPASPTSPAKPTMPNTPNVTVLVAEIPKGSSRWNQANFDKQSFENFFGFTIGEKKNINLQEIELNGNLGVVEIRPGVSVKSQNYRVELAAASGLPYPTGAAPIGVFVRVSPSEFRYVLLMPNDTDYTLVSSFLSTLWNGPVGRMRRGLTDTLTLKLAWPKSRLWVKAGTLF